jgi:hypothetical protein
MFIHKFLELHQQKTWEKFSSAVGIPIHGLGFGTFGAVDPLVNIEKAMENGPFIDVYRCFLMICLFKMVFLW